MLRSLILIQCVSLLVNATKIPIKSSSKNGLSRHLPKRATDGNVTIDDEKDRIYTVDITVAGTSYEAQIDSGSSDLWISTTQDGLKSLNSTSIPANLTYGVGFAAGTIAVGPVQFSGLEVPRQAFLAATQVDNPITGFNADALVGIGFDRLSNIDAQINASGGSYGRSLLFNLFAQDPSSANYMAVVLQRDDDPDSGQVGSISISEVDPEFSDVLQTSRISTFPAVDPLRWTLPIDAILVNGSAISTGTSVVSGAPTGKSIALFDTGTSFVYAPKNIVDSIYGSVSGASFSSALGMWICPCDAEIDVTITIDGRNFFLHPLDLSIPTLTDNSTCQGTWMPSGATDGTYDVLFGVAMLRSMVTVFNYGDFKDDLSLGDPYVQLLSLVTNGTQASDEFHAIRGGVPSQNAFPNNAGVNAPSSSSSSSGNSPPASTPDLLSLQSKVDHIYSFGPALFALTALNIIVLLAVAGAFFLRLARRRKRKASKSKNKSPKSSSTEQDIFDAEGGSYIPLSRPNASAQGQYRPVSMGTTIRDSNLYDAPKSPGQEKSFNYDSVKNVDDEGDLPLPRPRAPALRNSFRPLSSGSTLRDSRLYDIPKSPGYDKSFSFDTSRGSGAYDSSPTASPTTAVEMHPEVGIFPHEPLISIQETLSQEAWSPSAQPQPSTVYTQDITAQNIPINEQVLIEPVEQSPSEPAAKP